MARSQGPHSNPQVLPFTVGELTTMIFQDIDDLQRELKDLEEYLGQEMKPQERLSLIRSERQMLATQQVLMNDIHMLVILLGKTRL